MPVLSPARIPGEERSPPASFANQADEQKATALTEPEQIRIFSVPSVSCCKNPDSPWPNDGRKKAQKPQKGKRTPALLFAHFAPLCGQLPLPSASSAKSAGFLIPVLDLAAHSGRMCEQADSKDVLPANDANDANRRE
jgi:hypothetical protein